LASHRRDVRDYLDHLPRDDPGRLARCGSLPAIPRLALRHLRQDPQRLQEEGRDVSRIAPAN
jgi:hypothetical protein